MFIALYEVNTSTDADVFYCGSNVSNDPHNHWDLIGWDFIFEKNTNVSCSKNTTDIKKVNKFTFFQELFFFIICFSEFKELQC